ncbi:hypothetical protein PQX77_017592 [Marasmius sp. AFHP31]|nr:hypothetical protein PQX77_017592 [Marasmius sp. AFHP31]
MANTSRVGVELFGNLSKRLGILQFVSSSSFTELWYRDGTLTSCLGIVTGIELLLTSEDQRFLFDIKDPEKDFNPPCYLFVPPPPRLSDGAPDIETWLRGENLYYYSYDPEGGSAITWVDRLTLGLPSFISGFRMNYTYWQTEAYDFMEKWQRAKGFDYSTIDYAKSLGFPILEVIPRDFQSRFEDLTGMLLLPPLLSYPKYSTWGALSTDSPDVLEMDIDSGTDDQMDFTPTAGIEDDSSSLDMEIDVDT